jgi:hypothetical protein
MGVVDLDVSFFSVSTHDDVASCGPFDLAHVGDRSPANLLATWSQRLHRRPLATHALTPGNLHVYSLPAPWLLTALDVGPVEVYRILHSQKTSLTLHKIKHEIGIILSIGDLKILENKNTHKTSAKTTWILCASSRGNILHE